MAGVFAFPALLPTFRRRVGAVEDRSRLDRRPLLRRLRADRAAGAGADRPHRRAAGLRSAALSWRRCRAAGFALFAEGFWTALVFRALAGAGARRHLPAGAAGADRPLSRPQGRRARCPSTPPASASARRCRSCWPARSPAAFGWRAAFAVTRRRRRCWLPLVPLLLSRVSPSGRTSAAACSTSARCWPTGAPSPTCWATASTAGSCSRCAPGWWRSWPSASLPGRTPRQAAGCRRPRSRPSSGLVAMAASIGGNELCVRFGRRRVITLVMWPRRDVRRRLRLHRRPSLRAGRGARAASTPRSCSSIRRR